MNSVTGGARTKAGTASETAAPLLELAQWAVARLQGSADYVQAFAEHTLAIRVECIDGEVLATCVEPREGLSCLVRQGDRWRHRHVPVSAVQDIPQWLNGHDDGTHSPPCPERSGYPDFVPMAPTEWLIEDAGSAHSIRTIEDFTRRSFAVADTEGIGVGTTTSTVRQRVEVSVMTNGSRYRGLSRWLTRGEHGCSHPGARALAKVALGHALDAAQAVPVGGHRTPVVFGPSAAAGFLHELVGHALEGDNFALGSPYTVALRHSEGLPARLTLCDNPALVDGYGSYDIDDEGATAQATTLVANAAIGAPLTSVRVAHRNAFALTGNGRRGGYRNLTIPRASNTVVLPGTEDPALMLDSPVGLLHIGCLGAGEINLVTGEFSFAALDCSYFTSDGYRVPVRDVSLFGDALQTLRCLEAVGTDFGGDNVTCGKQGQMIGIGIFSPSMRYSALDWTAA
jgi:hypothetical protein